MATAAGLSPADGFSGATLFVAASCASILSSRPLTAERSAAAGCGGGGFELRYPRLKGGNIASRRMNVRPEILHLGGHVLNRLRRRGDFGPLVCVCRLQCAQAFVECGESGHGAAPLEGAHALVDPGDPLVDISDRRILTLGLRFDRRKSARVFLREIGLRGQ